MAAITTRHAATPLAVPRTRRNHDVRNMTSMWPGKMVPLAVIPLLREDDMKARFVVALESQETVEILLNNIDVVVETWVVPNLAFERFRTMDDINLAYTKNTRPGEALVPYFEKGVAGPLGSNEIMMRLGKHLREGQEYNRAYEEAYNVIVNFQRQEISPKIPLRDRLETDLAQAPWPVNKFAHIVPDWDDAVMEGEIALSISEQELVLRGPGNTTSLPVAGNPKLVTVEGNKDIAVKAGSGNVYSAPAATDDRSVTGMAGLRAELAGATAYLEQNGVKLSLANLALANKARVFANIRKKYNLNEEMLIDLLMDGITVPEQSWRNPIKLRTERTKFGMAKRYATNGDALTQSVVNGAAALEFGVSVPRIPCGGVVMVLAYIAPEQLFERQEDPYLTCVDPDNLPQYMPDALDPQAVEVVHCDYIDNDHDFPTDVYGYAPKHFKWNSAPVGIGGRFHRPEVDAGFDQDRQSLWAVETQNPRLTKDAYLVPEDIHLKPFWTSTIDPFDAVTSGQCVITGNTQFGPMLIESIGVSDYDEVLERVDQTRIEKVEVPL